MLDEVQAPPAKANKYARTRASAEDVVRRSEAVVYAFGLGSEQPDSPDVMALQRLTDPCGGTTQAITRDGDISAAAERLMGNCGSGSDTV